MGIKRHAQNAASIARSATKSVFECGRNTGLSGGSASIANWKVAMFETPTEILGHYASADAVDSFIAYRRKHKRAALSERGAMMIAKTLRSINEKGGDATEALDMAQEHGWQTIKEDWYFGTKSKTIHGANGGNTRADATTRAIAFSGPARRTPSSDSF